MKTANYNVVLNQGTDFSLVILIPGDSGPIDITGYNFSSVMKSSTDGNEDPVVDFNFTILNQTTNTGQVQWSLPSATTESIITAVVAASQPGCRTVTPYIYDILMTDTLNNKTRIIQGLILVSPGVTGETG